MSSKLLFRFRSETHGLNEELGIHSTIIKLAFCECECESAEHVLWKCSEYSNICNEFIRNLDGILQNSLPSKVIIR